MNYISQSSIHCSKGNLKCVLNCTHFPEKKSQWIYVQDKLGACFNKQKGKKHFTLPIFDSKILNE